MNDIIPENGEVWSPAKSATLYQIQGWGAPYFSVTDKGHIQVTPDPSRDRCINLYELVQDLEARGLDLPLLIRFSDIVAHRIKRINESFERAI